MPAAQVHCRSRGRAPRVASVAPAEDRHHVWGIDICWDGSVADRAGNLATGTFTVSVADDITQLRNLRAYVASLGRPARSLPHQVDAVLAAIAGGQRQRAVHLLSGLILQTRISPPTDAQKSRIVGSAERVRDYHRRP